MAISEQAPTGEPGGRGQTITVSVNSHDVRFDDRHVTGADIKEGAIAQGVPIQQDFALYEVKDDGALKPIADTDPVTLHPHRKFRAVAADDNS